MSARLRQYIHHLRESNEDEPFVQHRNKLIRKDRILGIILKIALVLFSILFVIYLWFLFTVHPQDTTTSAWVQKEKFGPDDNSTKFANELIQIASLTNFSSVDEKSKFLEKRLNELLEEYHRKKRDVPAFRFGNLSALPSALDITKIFGLFIKGYNDFNRRVIEADRN